MATYLLAWNPTRWQWDDLSVMSQDVKMGKDVTTRWSCGKTKRIRPTDRVFFICLGSEPKGIFGSGVVTVGSYEDLHWDDDRAGRGDTVMYVEVHLDTLLVPDVDPIIPRSLLNEARFSGMHWDTQMSGIQIPEKVASELEIVWSSHNHVTQFSLPEEVEQNGIYLEGSLRRVTVNAFERDPEARRQCLAFYGTKCVICGFDFEARYGVIGRGFIHVHHVRPLAEIREQYRVDPIRDLRPVCPNCHAVIHRRIPAFSIEEVQALLK